MNIPAFLLATFLAAACLGSQPTVLAESQITAEVIHDVDPLPAQRWSDEEAEILAKMLWGEARGITSDTEKAACVWCVLNRVDHGQGTITSVVTAPNQFAGYHANNPVDEDLITLCIDVLYRWYAEKDGQTDVGRVLPNEYLFFSGDGKRNYFRNAYKGGTVWNWSLPSPYDS